MINSLTKIEKKYFNQMLKIFYLYSTNKLEKISPPLDKIYTDLNNNESYQNIIDALNYSGFIYVELRPGYITNGVPELNYTGTLTKDGIEYIKNFLD